MAHSPQPIGTKLPSFALVRRLIDKGRTWVKLSVTYDNTKDGPPTYADVTKVAQAYVQAAPERMVWAATGRIRTKRTSRMMPCYSICSLDGGPMRQRGVECAAGCSGGDGVVA